MKRVALIMATVIGMSGTAMHSMNPSDPLQTTVRAELEALERERAAAFVSGECEKVVSFFDPEVVAYINGRRIPSTTAMLEACKRVTRPFPTDDATANQIRVLGDTAAFTLQVFELQPAEDGVMRREVITRLWSKIDERWRIVHLHVSINEVSSSPSP
jgi:ketosteroid isomerase-like protein